MLSVNAQCTIKVPPIALMNMALSAQERCVAIKVPFCRLPLQSDTKDLLTLLDMTTNG